jgi:hypothetical protein
MYVIGNRENWFRAGKCTEEEDGALCGPKEEGHRMSVG